MSENRFDFVKKMVNLEFGCAFKVSTENNRNYTINIMEGAGPVDSTDPRIIIFHFSEDLSNLYIDYLRRRIKDDVRLTEFILRMVDELAKLIPECKTISVEDNLNVYKCSYAFNHATITIFVNGISWYNHMGYRQASYDADTAYNNEIRKNMTVKAALTTILTSPETRGRFPELINYKTELERALNLDPKLTINSSLENYIRTIYTKLAPYSDDENKCNAFTRRNSQLFAYIINAFGHLLQYNGLLVKQVNNEAQAAAEAHNNPPPSSCPPRVQRDPVATAADDAELEEGSKDLTAYSIPGSLRGSGGRSLGAGLRCGEQVQFGMRNACQHAQETFNQRIRSDSTLDLAQNYLDDDVVVQYEAANEGGNDHNRGEGGTWQAYDGSQFNAVSAAEPVCSRQQQQQQQSFGSLLQRTMEGPAAMTGSYGGAIKSRKPTRRTNRRTRRRTNRRTNRRTSRKNKRNYVRRVHSKFYAV